MVDVRPARPDLAFDGPTRSPWLLTAAAVPLGLVGALFLAAASDDRGGQLVAGLVLAGMSLTAALCAAVRRRVGHTIAVALTGVLLLFSSIAAAARSTTGIVVIALVYAVALVLLINPQVLRWRRATRPEAAAEEADGVPHHSAATTLTQTPSGPWPEGWHREIAGGRVKAVAMGCFGVLAALAGLAMTADGRLAVGLGVTGFGATCVAATPLFWPRRNGGRPARAGTVSIRGQSMPATVLDYSRLRSLVAVIACLSFAAVGVAMMATPSTERRWLAARIFGFLAVVFFGLIGFFSVRRGAGRGWALDMLPDGIANVAGKSWLFAPWDAIEDVVAFDVTTYHRGLRNHEPMLGLAARDADTFESNSGRFARALMKSNRLYGVDYAVGVRALAVDPVRAYHALRFYHQHPQARDELADGRGAARINAGDLHPR